VSDTQGIRVIDNLGVSCEQIIKLVENQNNFTKAKISDQAHNKLVNEQIRNSSSVFVPFHAYSNDECVAQMNKLVWEQLDKYAVDYGFSFTSVEDVCINKYEKQEYYGYHYDYLPHGFRVLSAVLYLNNVVSGGELEFKYFNKYLPVQDTLVIFPSNYIYSHRSLEIKKGIKYSAAFWAQG
jgi:hypothetical protein